MPFEEALKKLRSKKLMPTNLSTDELRGVAKGVRKLSLYSARCTSIDWLSELRSVAQDMLDGKINMASGQQRMQEMSDLLGYSPETGFRAGEVPPAEAGSLRDLSSDRRTKLTIQMNVRLMANSGYMQAGQEDDARYQYPCWELVRIYPRMVPRDDWDERWVRAGGELFNGRMIARKDDPIWSNLGDSDLFRDGTDSDAPPYAYGSGKGVREVGRAESVALGVIDEDEEVQPREMSIAGDLFSDPESISLADLKASRDELMAAAAALRKAA